MFQGFEKKREEEEGVREIEGDSLTHGGKKFFFFRRGCTVQ